MNNPVVPLRDWLDVPALASPAAPMVRMLWIRFATPGVLGASVPTVGGIARGIPAFTLRLSQESVTQSTPPVASPAGIHFEATFAAPLSGSAPFLLEALDAQGQVVDAVACVGGQAALSLPAAAHVSLEPERFKFLAGTSDRLLERRAFSLLAIDTRLLIDGRGAGGHKREYKNLAFRSKSDVRVFKVAALEKSLNDAEQGLLKKLRARSITRSELLAQRRIFIRKALEGASVSLAPADRKSWLTRIEEAGSKRAPQNAKGGARPARQAGIRYFSLADALVLVDEDFAAEQDLVDRIVDELNAKFRLEEFGHRVGVLFKDRVRYRPAGLVVGEPFYTLALLPGEEVALRQVVETKRRGVLEDIRDREEERSLSLNATWSTDVTEGLNENSNRQSAFNTSGGGSVQAGAEVPIGAGLNLSSSVSEAHDTAAQWSSQTNQQMSTQATARQRSQHKIRLEITTEDSSTISATRTIRNANRLRSATHTFSKVYRREHATLERHGARLCLRLPVIDPSGPMRGSFLAGLDKLDPDNPALYEGGYPGRLTTQTSLPLETLPYRVGGGGGLALNLFEWTEKVDYWKELKLPADTLLTNGNTVPGNYVLAATPSVQLESFVLFDSGGKHFASDRTLTDNSKFKEYGGKIGWDSAKTPKAMQKDTLGRIEASANTTMYAIGFDEYLYGVKDIVVQVRAEWVPSTASLLELQSRHDTTRLELMGALENGAVQRLREAVDIDFHGAVLARAASDHLVFPAGFDLDFLRHVFDFEEAIVESVPYWATERGRMNYADLKSRLESLPVVMPVDAILTESLTASQAMVYLPVREGAELQALDFLPDIVPADRTWLAAEVTSYRSARFPSVAAALPTYDQVGGPRPPAGTPAGATAWSSSWEGPRTRFEVLAEWPELVPTDGVHIESKLSDSVVVDEHARAQLEQPG